MKNCSMRQADPSPKRDVLLLRGAVEYPAWGRRLQQNGWRMHVARDEDDAVQLLRSHEFRVGLVECDTRCENEATGWHERLLRRCADIHWVFLVDKGCLDQPDIRQRILSHCYDYHTFPVQCDRLATTLGRALGIEWLRSITSATGEQEMPIRHGIVGESPAMMVMLRLLEKAAPAEAPILISGESGTGKELVARAVHRLSSRLSGPFVVVNCASLAPTLIQSELFGHEKGAFTGAVARKVGRIELASGGTLFLDEIGELTPELQVNLLRFLQEGTIERIGGSETIRVDARVVAATNVDLESAVGRGAFREDLYYRLNVLRLHLPALRERGDDVLHLARFYLDRIRADERRRAPTEFSPQAVKALCRYSWPGNVRELVNKVRRAIILAEGPQILPSDLEFEDVADKGISPRTLEQARCAAEWSAVQESLLRNGNNVALAAEELGVSRVTVYRLLEKYRSNRQTGRTLRPIEASAWKVRPYQMGPTPPRYV